MLLPDTSFLLNIIIHSVLLSNDSGVLLLSWSCEGFLFAKIYTCLHPRYLVLVLLWIIGWYSTQLINTRTKKCRKYVHVCFFFCPILAYFLRMTLSSSLPFVTHVRVTWLAPFSLHHYRACLRFNRENKKCS